MSVLTFPRGTYHFNDHPLFDFQLNPGGHVEPWRSAEVQARGGEITDFPSWERVLKELSAQAEAQEDWAAAAGYLRMAEFFMVPDTPECHAVYDRAREIFYTHFTYLFAEKGGPIHREEVPYADGVLPCWRFVPAGASKGAILFHGGNDSLLEEFTDALLYLAQGGYTVLAFEGPGQGGPAEIRPDLHAGVGEAGGCGAGPLWADNVTIIGVSLGGELCMRAAAMEPRIRRVVSWSVLPSIYGALMADKPAEIRAKLEHWLDENNREAILDLYAGLAGGGRCSLVHPALQLRLRHLPTCEYLQRPGPSPLEPVAEQITQDVLLLSAREDLLVDLASTSRRSTC